MKKIIDEIIEKYRDIPEVHTWKDSTLEDVSGSN